MIAHLLPYFYNKYQKLLTPPYPHPPFWFDGTYLYMHRVLHERSVVFSKYLGWVFHSLILPRVKPFFDS